jgi:hypothetical protein
MKQTIERMEDEGYLYDCDKEWELNNSYFMLVSRATIASSLSWLTLEDQHPSPHNLG